MYEVVYDANTKIQMTQEEVQKFLLAIQNQDVVEFKGQFLTKFFRVIAKKEITEGRLHDGTRVIKRFGQWVDAENPDVRLDRGYYPEIANDTVMSEEEFLAHINLPLHERIKKIGNSYTQNKQEKNLENK